MPANFACSCPRRPARVPDSEREPRLAELWRQAYSRPMRYTKAALAIDPIMSKRDPLVRFGEADAVPWGTAVFMIGFWSA